MNRLTKEDYIDWEYRTGYYKKEYVKRLNEKTLKLGRLEDIEEELGCPLEVVFKALTSGITAEIIIETDFSMLKELDTFERPRLYYSDDFKCYHLETGYGASRFKLKDYQKTWWLKGEKENV